jgi:drug/metabolite transporter (DMT)-like permease
MWVSTSFWAFGLEYVSATDSAVLCFAMPLFAIPISSVILSEKPSISEWGGAVVGFLGVLVYSLALTNHALTVLGGVLTLVNAVFWAMATVYYRKLRSQEPTMTVATQLFVVALLLLICAPLNYRLVIVPNFWFDLAYLSILSGALNFSLWNGLVRSQKIGKSSTLVYLIPVTATLAQSVQTSFVPDPVSLTGLIMMTLGIYIANGTVALQTNTKRLGVQILKRFQGLHL